MHHVVISPEAALTSRGLDALLRELRGASYLLLQRDLTFAYLAHEIDSEAFEAFARSANVLEGLSDFEPKTKMAPEIGR